MLLHRINTVILLLLLHLLDLCEALVAVFTLVTPTLIHRDGLMSLLVFNQILLQHTNCKIHNAALIENFNHRKPNKLIRYKFKQLKASIFFMLSYRICYLFYLKKYLLPQKIGNKKQKNFLRQNKKICLSWGTILQKEVWQF